jgi:hypothetical protein
MSQIENMTKDLRSTMDIEQLFHKYVVDGQSVYFRDIQKQPNQEYLFRHELATLLDVNLADVVIVGSAKLGFSIKNHSFVRFDEGFDKNKNRIKRSDIDVAIINKKYFDKVVALLFNFSRHYDKGWIKNDWADNLYNNGLAEGLLFQNYTYYLARGWLRPDYMPNRFLNEADWIPKINEWKNKLNRNISIAIYSDWFYLKHYHMDNLKTIRSKLNRMVIQNVR